MQYVCLFFSMRTSIYFVFILIFVLLCFLVIFCVCLSNLCATLNIHDNYYPYTCFSVMIVVVARLSYLHFDFFGTFSLVSPNNLSHSFNQIRCESMLLLLNSQCKSKWHIQLVCIHNQS